MYRIVHRTNYRYSAPVSRCRNEAHLRPRDTDRQHCLASDLVVEPTPTSWSERTDFFGNPVFSFVVDGPFDELTVTSTSSVSVSGREPLPATGPAWEQVRDRWPTDLSAEMLAAREFCFESPLVPPRPGSARYAEPSFPAGRPLVEGDRRAHRADLQRLRLRPRVHHGDHAARGGAAAFRRGVCQDFAHLAIGCLRSMGLAARYVSGYLETAPPEGEERLVGADASHAWPSVFVPGWGWLDVDPTNDKIVGSTYVTTAWGRDYSDVSPLKGIVFGGGDSHLLDVSVDVTRSPVRPTGGRLTTVDPAGPRTPTTLACRAHPDHRRGAGHRRGHRGRAVPGRPRGHRHGPGRLAARGARRGPAPSPRRHRRGIGRHRLGRRPASSTPSSTTPPSRAKGPWRSFPIDRLPHMFETNTFGPLRIVQQVLPGWRSPGKRRGGQHELGPGPGGHAPRGSLLGHQVRPRGLSETLHYELGHFGIRVVIIQPGYIAPGMKPADEVTGEPRLPASCGNSGRGPT